MKKYLKRINYNSNTNLSNKIDILENKIFKFLISFLLIILLLIWDIIPFEILKAFNIGVKIDPITNIKVLNLPDNIIYTISFFNSLLFIGILIKLYYKDIKINLYKYFNHNFKTNIKTSICYWLVGLFIMYFSNIVIGIIMNGQIAENETAVRNLIDDFPLYMAFSVMIYAPIAEELVFRKSIREFINNKWIYALVSGFIFGGLHAITSITDYLSLLYLIPYCSLGITFGLLYYKTDNIFSTIIVHSIHNTLAFILYMVIL